MKKIIILLVLLFGLFLPAYAQLPLPSQEPIKPVSATPLAPDESKALKQAFDLAGQAENEAKAAADRSAARNAEAKALYWQLIVLKKIDIEKWDFAGFDDKGLAQFVEKPPQQAKAEEKKDAPATKPK